MPLKLATFARPEAPAFLVLFTLDTLARAMLVTVVPLQAYDLLADAQKVSVLYFMAGTIGLCGSLGVPYLVARLHRREGPSDASGACRWRKRLSFKALCSTQFSDFGAQLRICHEAHSCADHIQR